MAVDLDKARKLQADLRRVATRYTVEETLYALAALAGEAVYLGAVTPEARGTLCGVFGQMVVDALVQAQKGPQRAPLAGLN